MLVAVAASGKSLEDQVDLRFGRCSFFLIIDTKTDKFEIINNSASQAFRGAGVAASQIVVDKGVKAVIAGNIGPNALNILNQSNIKVYSGFFNLTVKQALKKLKNEKPT